MDSHLRHLPYSMEALQYPHFHHPLLHHQPTSIPTSVIRSTAAATAAASVSHPLDPKLLYDPFFLSLLQAPPNFSCNYIKLNPLLQNSLQWPLPPLYSAIVQQPPTEKTTPIKPVPIRFSAPLFQPYLNDNFNKNTRNFKKSLAKPYEKPLNLSKKPKEVESPATSAENSSSFNPNSPKNCTFPVNSKLKLSQVIDKIFTDAFERCMFEE